MEQETKRNIPRDLFLHLLAMITLYWSAISFTTLLWQFINRSFPDSVAYYAGDYGFQVIRFSVSALIIVFPIFIGVSWYLNQIYRKGVKARESRIRKWLIYLTLFVASLIIIGDSIGIINTFLSGEITARFILKALSVIIVAGVIFGYYLDDVRRDAPTKLARQFAIIAGFLVLVTVVSSFIIIGSPNSARAIQLDQQRASDLQGIQMQIINYWQRKNILPSSLSDLNDVISGYMVPKDPVTGAAYKYAISDMSSLSFSLCATFSKPTQNDVPAPYLYGGNNQTWNHGEGLVCFSRMIDKQLYPPINITK